MLARTTIFLLITFIAVLRADDCPNDKSDIAPMRLRKDLLCGYDKMVRPVVNHKDAITVVIRMILKFYSYDHHTSGFTVDSWLALFWKDEHLQWNPADYGSLTSTHLSTEDIWMPDISIYNRNDQSGNPSAIESASCMVQKTGQVACVPPSRQYTLCVADLTRYPFDTQNCTVRFGSWVHTGEEIDLQLPKQPITVDDVVPNGEWALIDTKVVKHPGRFKCCPNTTYPSLNFSFKIKRLTGAHAASVILPAVALIIITITSLWIAPKCSERLMLCCVNIICQFLYAQYVCFIVPMNGDKIPLIILFARDSLCLSAFTIILAVALKRMVEKEGSPPVWISTLVSLLIGFRVGQFIFLNNSTAKGVASARGEDDGASIINNSETATNNSNSQDWVIFANILDRICFVAYFIVYLCTFIAFTP